MGDNPSVAVKATSTNQLFHSTQNPNIYNSTSAYILGKRTILPNSSATLSISMKGNPPYNFTINGQNFATNSNPYYHTVSPNSTTNYVLENFRNSCDIGNQIVNSTLITVAKCQSNILHSGNLNGGVFKSINPIESNGILISPQNLQYESEKTIILSNGFKIENGATFKATIKNCQD